MESLLKTKTSQMGEKGQMTYFMLENEGKDTLLMLHPAFADHTIFETQLAYFKNNYQIIAIDLPGHGNRNNRVGASKMTIKDMPEAISRTPMPYPMLIIVGEHDLPIIKEAAVELQKREIEAHLVILQEAGHCANADAPHLFNPELELFLSEI
ncbi:alpha/beta fold hydrolase [Paenibacillus sp. LPE1-1-1.1]|uniref:alpha/beta fold hydrolase n=1 Tax=Paenibacillus sp. LPE1-1-1.1 TaxID=3135230 RepID=UPI003417B9C3